jgi:hypothetical protein
MMLFQTGRGIDPGNLSTRLHSAGFAEIDLGNGAELFVNTPEEADALIKAAVTAKDLLLAVPAGECSLCGHAHGLHRDDCVIATAAV